MMKIRKKLVNIAKSVLPYVKEYDNINYKTPMEVNYISLVKFHIGLIDRYWPASRTCIIVEHKNIYIGKNSKIGRSGNYIQGGGGIYVGDYVQVASNVGILSQNHDLYDHSISIKKEVIIGDYCWIGMNSVILPGVTLGTRTIVAAGSVVTKSFNEGYCVIGGNPARVIKKLEQSDCKFYTSECEYYGFYDKDDFENKFPEKIKILRDKLNTIIVDNL